jgi:hypothetical protein
VQLSRAYTAETALIKSKWPLDQHKPLNGNNYLPNSDKRGATDAGVVSKRMRQCRNGWSRTSNAACPLPGNYAFALFGVFGCFFGFFLLSDQSPPSSGERASTSDTIYRAATHLTSAAEQVVWTGRCQQDQVQVLRS